MHNLGQYILSVITAATITSIISNFTDSKSYTAPYIKLVCSLFMTITIFTPLLNFKLNDIPDLYIAMQDDAQSIAMEGEAAAHSQKLVIIKEQLEAYILEKAEAMGLDITVDITFADGNDLLPQSITICGSVAPYAKSILATTIANDLGIAEDKQQWY